MRPSERRCKGSGQYKASDLKEEFANLGVTESPERPTKAYVYSSNGKGDAGRIDWHATFLSFYQKYDPAMLRAQPNVVNELLSGYKGEKRRKMLYKMKLKMEKNKFDQAASMTSLLADQQAKLDSRPLEEEELAQSMAGKSTE